MKEEKSRQLEWKNANKQIHWKQKNLLAKSRAPSQFTFLWKCCSIKQGTNKRYYENHLYSNENILPHSKFISKMEI